MIRERCWLYFSLYEQIIAQWWDKKKYTLKYQSTALALFESFMSTFDWPFKLEKGILRENPLKSSPFKFIRKKATPEHLECLLDTALNKLRIVFEHYFFCWSSCHSKTPSFLRWLISRHEPRLLAKIKDYISQEEIYFQQDEIPSLDKRNLYRLVQEIHEDFCKELNLITQMILSIWFQEIGIRVSHMDLASKLSKPGRWLYLNQEEPLTSKCPIHRFAYLMLKAIGELGVGVYFFPPLQQRWSSFQEALAAHSGNDAEFVRQHDAEIAAIIKKLLLMFHTDHQAEAERNNPKLKNITQDCITYINSAKQRLQEFRKRVANERQSINIKTEEEEATLLLRWLKYVVLYCVDYHVIYVRNMDRLLSLSDDVLRRCGDEKTYEAITKIKQREADMINARKELKEIEKELKEACKETEAAQAREEAERKEKEAAQAEVERLRALLAERAGQTPLQPSVLGSRVTFFSELAASQAANNTAENPIFDVRVSL